MKFYKIYKIIRHFYYVGIVGDFLKLFYNNTHMTRRETIDDIII